MEIKDILKRNNSEAELLYYYELNRLTISYMNNGNPVDNALKTANDWFFGITIKHTWI